MTARDRLENALDKQDETRAKDAIDMLDPDDLREVAHDLVKLLFEAQEYADTLQDTLDNQDSDQWWERTRDALQVEGFVPFGVLTTDQYNLIERVATAIAPEE